MIVNPALVENQLTGMLVRSVSRTLFEGVTFSKQRVTSLDWVSYPILRFKESPTVSASVIGHTEIVPAVNSPIKMAGPRYRGVGESMEAAAPAAIGNAIFDATGVRMRQVPLTPAKVRAALKAAGVGVERKDKGAGPAIGPAPHCVRTREHIGSISRQYPLRHHSNWRVVWRDYVMAREARDDRLLQRVLPQDVPEGRRRADRRLLDGAESPATAKAADSPYASNGPFDQYQVDSWITINADNTASIKTGGILQGTGSDTGLLMIAGEELNMDMSQLEFVLADTNVTPNSGKHSASNTIKNGGPGVRAASASAAQALLGLASTQLGVPDDEL